MIETGIVSKVKIQDVLSNQLPNFIRDESPLTVDFLNNIMFHKSIKVVLVIFLII